MRPPKPDSESAVVVRKWATTVLSDFYSFYPDKIGERFPIFEIEQKWPFSRMLLDGLAPPRPEWAGDRHQPSEVLHGAILRAYQRKPSHWVELLFHDGAYVEVRDVIQAKSEHAVYILGILSNILMEPAEQGGDSFIALLYDDHSGMLLFTSGGEMEPPYPLKYKIDFYGDADGYRELMEDFTLAASAEV